LSQYLNTLPPLSRNREDFEKMAYQRQAGVERSSSMYLSQQNRNSRDEPWRRIPPFIIDKMRREEERKRKQYDDHRQQPSLYDDYRQPTQLEQKKDEERGIIIVDMTVTPSLHTLEYML
jgi:hypothetical protein